MAANTIGGRPVIVARHAAQRIASRGTAMEFCPGRVAAHPTDGVSVDCASARGAHAALDVTVVAALRVMTTQTSARTRARFDAVPNQEIAHMLELTFDAVRFASLDE
jgi:hypothetical protein